MSSTSAILAALKADLELINGSGGYTFDLTGEGAIQIRHPDSPTTTPQLRIWGEEAFPQDGDPVASLSGMSLRFVVGVALYVDAQADLSDGAARAQLALDDLLRWAVREDQRALGGLVISFDLVDSFISAGAQGRNEPAAFARFEAIFSFEPGD